jgi:hypothetical protein
MMSDEKWAVCFTPGPWELDSQELGSMPWFRVLAPLVGRTGVLFDTFNADHVLDPNEHRDNMRLASAALDLLAALELEEAFSEWTCSKSDPERNTMECFSDFRFKAEALGWTEGAYADFVLMVRRAAIKKAREG